MSVKSRNPRWWRRILRWLGLALVAAVLFALVTGWRAFGHGASGARKERMHASPEWQATWSGGHFENPQPLWNDALGMVTQMFEHHPPTSPSTPPPYEPVPKERFATPPPGGLRVTWLGHSTTIIEIDGHRFVTDPIWSERAGPFSWVGPTRWVPPALAFDDLPEVDAVLISHDHYDHFDYATIVRLAARGVRFIVPLGVGAHLEYWGVPRDHIVEVDWWDKVTLGDLTVVCTPARHASGRAPWDKDATLWAGYALVGAQHRVFFSGDTGLFPAMTKIGADYGPFDLTMIEVGQYGRAWPDWHIGPEQAVRAHTMLRGKVLLPIHWSLFALAFHGWTEPIERVLVEAKAKSAVVLTPKIGEAVTPESTTTRWWPDVPWTSATADPIVSTKVD